MNPDDYDEDGNNIVPCPICLDVYCPGKDGGKCPEEDAFAAHYNMKAKVLEIQGVIAEKVTGIWQADHDDYGHRYLNTISGLHQRSVTTKLAILNKPHLLNWAVRMAAEWLLKEDRLNRIATERFRDDMIKGMQLAHADIRDDAGGVGTIAHNAAERYINEWIASGVLPENIVTFAIPNPDPRSIASMRAVEQYFKKKVIYPIASELLVGDERFSAGTLDFLAFVDGKLTLVDFKTSNAIDKESYSMQVAAYKYFFEKMTGLKIENCIILHLSKDYDKFEVWKVLNIAKAWKAFKEVCMVYDWSKDRKDKIIKDIKRIKI